ncbi:MAG: hypothetical protein D3923_17830 [Candidatus Electrothrix sp. AR3]|nr:hypothetical protein [Candidatus Electrothrix sp. AR3]
MPTKERYINLFTDYGFKKIFGEEPNKNLLLDFLNELLKKEQEEIRDLTYLKIKINSLVTQKYNSFSCSTMNTD